MLLELKWLRLGQVTNSGNTGITTSVEILHELAQLIMAQSLLGLAQAVDSQAEDSAQWPDLSSGKGTRRLFYGLTVLQIQPVR